MAGSRDARRGVTVLSGRSAARIIASGPDLAFVVGFDGRFRQISAGWTTELGHSPAALSRIQFADLVHPEDRSEVIDGFERMLVGSSQCVDMGARLRTRGGVYHRFAWRASVASHERLVYGTARRSSEADCDTRAGPDDAARNRLLGRATDVLVASDVAGVFTYVSPACHSLLGYAPDELIGRRMTGFVHPDDSRRVQAGAARAAEDAPVSSVTARYRRKDGSYAWVDQRIARVTDPETGELVEMQAVLRDIGDLMAAQAAVEAQALTDTLTGLANRVLLSDRLTQSLRHLKRHGGLVAVIMLDLDHFKVINDTLGHQVGDEVLICVAQRLRALARPDDTVARFGGDEFVVIAHGLKTAGDVAGFAERIVAAFRTPQVVGDAEVVTTASVGVATASRPDQLAPDLLREADLALYRAKDRGRDRHEVYGEALRVRAVQRLETEQLLRRALAEKRLAVEFQPIVDLSTGQIVEAEALLRIDDPELGRLTANHFLGVAEETGLLAVMDEWVRASTIAQLASWRSHPDLAGIARISVNTTAREMASPDFPARVVALLGEHGLVGSDLAIEVTEHVLLQSSHSAMSSLAELRSSGVRVGLDDFGTGFSALAHLQTFPLDFLKIDRTFVQGILVDRRSASIVAAIIALAQALDLTVVAEGVETAGQLEQLRSFGCDRGQGFMFARPLGAAAFAHRVRQHGITEPRSPEPGREPT